MVAEFRMSSFQKFDTIYVNHTNPVLFQPLLMFQPILSKFPPSTFKRARFKNNIKDSGSNWDKEF